MQVIACFAFQDDSTEGIHVLPRHDLPGLGDKYQILGGPLNEGECLLLEEHWILRDAASLI